MTIELDENTIVHTIASAELPYPSGGGFIQILAVVYRNSETAPWTIKIRTLRKDGSKTWFVGEDNNPDPNQLIAKLQKTVHGLGAELQIRTITINGLDIDAVVTTLRDLGLDLYIKRDA